MESGVNSRNLLRISLSFINSARHVGEYCSLGRRELGRINQKAIFVILRERLGSFVDDLRGLLT
jgi:hypothetical protein